MVAVRYARLSYFRFDEGFPIDSMHLLYEGVVQDLWCQLSGAARIRMYSREIQYANPTASSAISSGKARGGLVKSAANKQPASRKQLARGSSSTSSARRKGLLILPVSVYCPF